VKRRQLERLRCSHAAKLLPEARDGRHNWPTNSTQAKPDGPDREESGPATLADPAREGRWFIDSL
jgi:hypothetical protein